MMGKDGRALWGSHRPAPWARGVQRMDGFKGNSCFIFRNDGGPLSSVLIREAVAITSLEWDLAPFITYVAINKVNSRNPGYCFIMAGFKKVGVRKKTKHGPMLRLEMDIDTVRECVREFLLPKEALNASSASAVATT